ncbi:lysylphosphatidylglycerol synthase transmembrane domain-containing protein [Actinoplanes sp. NPDC051851]|uniref:lysylphosphatidylglycerol synthase transmembrane domain-containing protein n=1 Tax=Actinoplanes sp. NPDC051851 TaxID=3154753 RepID=UPI00343ECF1A
MSRQIWAWLRLLGGAGILVLVLWRLGTGAFLDGLRVLDAGTLSLAFGLGVATTLLSAWRWCLVSRGMGLTLSMRAATADYYQALFLNAALPGGVLGDVGRAVRHGREEGDVGRGVRAVVLERTAGQFVLLGAGGVVLLTVPSPVLTLIREHAAAVAVTAAGAALVAGAALLVVRRLRTGGSRLAGAARTGTAEIRSGLMTRRTAPGVLLASAGVLAGHLATFVVAARAAGNGVPVLDLMPLLLLALLAMGIPLNVGGWGPREGVLAWAFGAAGLSAGQGVTIAVAYGICAFVAAVPGAVVVVARLLPRLQAQPSHDRTTSAVRADAPAAAAGDAPTPVTPLSPTPAVPVSPAVVLSAPDPVRVRRATLLAATARAATGRATQARRQPAYSGRAAA